MLQLVMDLMLGSGLKKTKPQGKWREKLDHKDGKINNCTLNIIKEEES